MAKKPIRDQVVLASRGGDGLDAAVAELGENAHAVQADVASLDDCHRIVEEAIDRFGRVDTFSANAMVTVYQEARDLRPEELRRVIDVNFLGAVNCYWAALPRLVETQGAFSHVSSAFAYRGIPLQAAYCSSKAAGRTFFETARVEHQKHGVPVFEPLPGDKGARGRFSDRSRRTTLWTSLRLRRRLVGGVAVGLSLATMGLTNGRAKSRVR
jgi:NAD(P)-dependent dehydrogenase (short-subunit alcohol dehydrogenase family)